MTPKPQANKTIEDLRVTIKPKHPFAYGDTLTFNLPPETIAEIHQLMLQERINELESLHDDLSLEAREAGACDLIHQKTNKLIDQLKEKSKP